MSAREELPLAIEAMKLGALDFLGLPPKREVLALALAPAWRALERAIEAGAARREALDRISRLTAREIDISLALLNGGSNKTVAHKFGISVRTVEMHRAHIMAKLGVKNLAEAAVLATQAGLVPLNQHNSLPSRLELCAISPAPRLISNRSSRQLSSMGVDRLSSRG